MAVTMIGVMGPVGCSEEVVVEAESLGRRIAEEGWVLLCGGRDAGVMAAVCRGADRAGGTIVGVLPGEDREGASPDLTIPIVTGMGSARNNINVLSSAVVVACGMGAGTASEIALAIKAGKPVVLLRGTAESDAFWRQLAPEQVEVAGDVEDAVRLIRARIG